MDIERAITYVTSDPDWLKKVLTGGAIMLASWIGSFLLVGIVGYFLLLGYAVQVVRNVYDGIDTPLPEWRELSVYILSGLTLFGALMLWTLPLVALLAAGITVGALAASDTGGFAFLASLCLAGPLLLMVSLFITPVLTGRYAVRQEFSALFEFTEVLTEARRAFVPSLILSIVGFIAAMLAQFGIVACFIGVFATTWYAYLVIAHLTGQVYRHACGLGSSVARF